MGLGDLFRRNKSNEIDEENMVVKEQNKKVLSKVIHTTDVYSLVSNNIEEYLEEPILLQVGAFYITTSMLEEYRRLWNDPNLTEEDYLKNYMQFIEAEQKWGEQWKEIEEFSFNDCIKGTAPIRSYDELNETERSMLEAPIDEKKKMLYTLGCVFIASQETENVPFEKRTMDYNGYKLWVEEIYFQKDDRVVERHYADTPYVLKVDTVLLNENGEKTDEAVWLIYPVETDEDYAFAYDLYEKRALQVISWQDAFAQAVDFIKERMDKVVPAFGLGYKLFASDILTFRLADQKIWELIDAGKEEFSLEELDQILREANDEAREMAEREGLEFVDVLGDDDEESSYEDIFDFDDHDYEEDQNSGEISK